MKRLLALFLALMLLCPAALADASPAAQYEAAAALMISGDYAGAVEAFTALSAYMDAPQMAIYCNGLALMSAGDYARAEKAFAVLGDFKDAAVQRVVCQGMAKQQEGERLMGSGTLGELLAAEPTLLAAAACFDSIDFLPAMAARAAACRAYLAPLEARRFDGLGRAKGDLCAVEKDGKAGVVNTRGELVLPCEWDEVYVEATAIVVVRDEKVGLYSLAGEEIWPCTADRYSTWSDELPCLITSQTVDGVETARRQFFLPDGTALPENLRLDEFATDELAILYDYDTGAGYLYNVPEKRIVQVVAEADWCRVFADGYVTATQAEYYDGVVHYYDASGQEQPVPENAWPFRAAGIWIRESDAEACLLDIGGNVIFRTAGDLVGRSVSGLPEEWLCFYVRGEKPVWYLLDVQGHVLLTADNILAYYKDGLVVCERDGKQVLEKVGGDVLLTAETIHRVTEGRYVTLTEGGAMWLQDLQSDIRFEVATKDVLYRGEGVFSVMLENKEYILVDATGARLNDQTYELVYGDYRDGYLKVESNDLYSMLDTQGEIVFELRDVDDWSAGEDCLFMLEGGWLSVCDNAGNPLLEEGEAE